MSRGTFVTFEGIEGAGKTTQLRTLAERLERSGLEVVVTREPGGTAFGGEIRRLLLERGSDDRLDPRVEALLMVADRAEHVRRVLRPAIEAGRVVVCDRHAHATEAYQGGGSGVPRETIAELNRFATGGLRPDLVVFLDLPPGDALSRLRARGSGALDRFESEPESFFERVRERYLELSREGREPWLVLDARAKPAELADTIESAVRTLVEGRGREGESSDPERR